MTNYIPLYKRSPNKFIRYEMRRFNDSAGHQATLRIAIFSDKSNKQQEAIAHVIWDI